MTYKEKAIINGESFLNAFRVLNAIVSATTKLKQGFPLTASLTIPAIVNIAFACELFMKSLLPEKMHGHNLDKLFKKLDSDIQAEIISNVVAEMKKSHPVYEQENFEENLIQNATAFEKWRYFHESSHLAANIAFLSLFADELHRVAKRI